MFSRWRNCTSKEVCQNDWSWSNGTLSERANVQCCETNLCNKNYPPGSVQNHCVIVFIGFLTEIRKLIIICSEVLLNVFTEFIENG